MATSLSKSLATSLTLPHSVAAMSRLSVVFGGSRGIGRAVAMLLAQRGHRVVVISRNQEAAQATAAALPGGNHSNLYPPTNTTQTPPWAYIMQLNPYNLNYTVQVQYELHAQKYIRKSHSC